MRRNLLPDPAYREVWTNGQTRTQLGSPGGWGSLAIESPLILQTDSEDPKQASYRQFGRPDWMVTILGYGEDGGRELARVRSGYKMAIPVPAGPVRVEATTVGMVRARSEQASVRERIAATIKLVPERETDLAVVGFEIVDEDGWQVPAKVSFRRDDGRKVDFGPISEVEGVRDVRYFTGRPTDVVLPTGDYTLAVSRGPEYDLTERDLTVAAGSGEQTVRLVVRRAYPTLGWISADFHSHSTPSGDNTSHQRGRVMNLVCEDIDFAPCTEHQRIDSYQTHIDKLGLGPFIGSATGMELTGSDLPINHHNVFPLVMKQGLQDGGGPLVGKDPDVQIERLALWDDRSEKLIQQNHPDLRRLLEDRDNDRETDEGFARGVGLLDCVEIHPIEMALQLFPNAPERREGLREGFYSERIVRWLDLIARRPLPGVINTDAHWNYHGSGWTRNWIAVPDDDPARCEVLEIVRATEAGRVVMSNGPFLTMTAAAGEAKAGLGETIAAADGHVDVTVEVRCANWLDVDRVGLVVNGTMPTEFFFLREAEDDGFRDEGPLRFARTVRVPVDGPTTIVAVCGDVTRTLGIAAGGEAAKQNPAAMTNAIYVTP